MRPSIRCSETLAARTLRGLHDDLVPHLARFLKPQGKVLDLGAGTGAWAERLLGLGYDVTCVERDIDGFALDTVPCICANLNEDFSVEVPASYAALTSIEVIDHLENPRHF